jgi:hypothetical protein
MEWILKPAGLMLGPYVAKRLADGRHYPSRDDYAAAVKGLSGLVVLGDAWESVDIFAAMAHLLERGGEASLSHLASLRCRELITAGRRSLSPDAPTEAKALIKVLRFISLNPLTSVNEGHNKALYTTLRADADAWQARHAAYLVERLQAGRHPDTESAFWGEFRDSPPPRLEMPWPREWANRHLGMYWPLFAIAAGVVGGITLLCMAPAYLSRALRRHRLSRALAEREQ